MESQEAVRAAFFLLVTEGLRVLWVRPHQAILRVSGFVCYVLSLDGRLVFRVGDLLEPFDGFAVEGFLDGDV